MNNKPLGYVDSEYLSAARDLFAPIKLRSYALMGNLASKQVLDIGCGPGLDTVKLAELVGERGRVDGIDHDQSMIREAQMLSSSHNSNERLRHQVANALDLPFDNNCFDAVRSERLLMHLREPEKALSEAVRVARPGGRLVVVDTDWGSLSTNSGANDIERKLVQFRAEQYLANGYSGRRLYGLFQALPVNNIRLESTTLHTTDLALWLFLTRTDEVAEVACKSGVFSQSDLQQWNDALKLTSDENAFFASIGIITVSATVA